MRISDWSSDVCSSDLRKVANSLGSGTEKMEIDRKNKVLPRANRIIKQSLPLASLSRCGTNSCAGIKTETQQVVVLSDGAIRRSSAFVLLEKRIFAIRSPIGRTKMINGAHASRAIDRVERNGNIGRRIWISGTFRKQVQAT